MTGRVIVLGECMVELYQLVENVYHQNFAGDVFNTAVYLKRMNPAVQVDFFTAVGTDLISDKLLAAVEAEKLGSSLMLRSKTARPGLYMINTDCFGERSFVYWRDSSAAKQTIALYQQQLTLGQLSRSDWFYFSGISLAILPEADRETLFGLLAELKAAGVKIAFDPNYRPTLWRSVDDCKAAFVRAYALSDLALPGLDDHKVLFNAQSTEDVVVQLAELGVAEIVVKNGKEGATVHTSAESFHMPAVTVKKVVDTTAAGDSFNGGYLAARLAGKDAKAAARLAAALAAFVVEHTGAIVSHDNFRAFTQRYTLN
ncbi:sugar kinase [Rheinheimera sp.]|uniref:sugar kinase n=1 Tax=Rheinheimera sp. TaxID=1869214 RepID=UPI00307D0644